MKLLDGPVSSLNSIHTALLLINYKFDDEYYGMLNELNNDKNLRIVKRLLTYFQSQEFTNQLQLTIDNNKSLAQASTVHNNYLLNKIDDIVKESEGKPPKLKIWTNSLSTKVKSTKDRMMKLEETIENLKYSFSLIKFI